MKKNIGRTDKGIRYILGALIVLFGIYFNNWWGLLGLIPILTALIGWCPLYVPLKLKTNKNE